MRQTAKPKPSASTSKSAPVVAKEKSEQPKATDFKILSFEEIMAKKRAQQAQSDASTATSGKPEPKTIVARASPAKRTPKKSTPVAQPQAVQTKAPAAPRRSQSPVKPQEQRLFSPAAPANVSDFKTTTPKPTAVETDTPVQNHNPYVESGQATQFQASKDIDLDEEMAKFAELAQ